MRCIQTYRLFELILPRFDVDKRQSFSESQIQLQKNALNDLLRNWINEKIYFEYPTAANARIQLEELKYYLRHYPDFAKKNNVELRITHVPKIDFLPSVLVAEYLGILRLKSFEYRHRDDLEINKHNFVENHIYMEFVVDILDLEIKIKQPDKKDSTIIYEEKYTEDVYKTQSGDIFMLRIDSNHNLQYITYNKDVLRLMGDELRNEDLKVLAQLISAKGSTVNNETMRDTVGLKNDDAIDKSISRLRNNANISCIETKRGIGRYLK